MQCSPRTDRYWTVTTPLAVRADRSAVVIFRSKRSVIPHNPEERQCHGGRLLVTGQDRALAWDALDSDGDSYIYLANPGTKYLQDSVFDPGVLPPAPSIKCILDPRSAACCSTSSA